MNLKNIPDQKLLADTDRIAQAERTIAVELLHHLKEIDRRRLYSDLKYSSLFDYAVKHLKYSEDQAYRRITACRLLAEIPEIGGQLASGELTLTNVTVAENFFRRERKSGRAMSASQKREFLRKIRNKSSREAERLAYSASPEMSAGRIEVGLNISPETLEMFEEIKGLMAHTHPGLTMEQFFEMMCKQKLTELKNKKSPAAPRVSRASVRRQVWKRDGGRCCNCGSKYALEIDHIRPRALGGGDEPENLRLLCRKCNQRSAIVTYGQYKMKRYLRSPRRPFASGVAVNGSSGHECLGYRARNSLRTST